MRPGLFRGCCRPGSDPECLCRGDSISQGCTGTGVGAQTGRSGAHSSHVDGAPSTAAKRRPEAEAPLLEDCVPDLGARPPRGVNVGPSGPSGTELWPGLFQAGPRQCPASSPFQRPRPPRGLPSARLMLCVILLVVPAARQGHSFYRRGNRGWETQRFGQAQTTGKWQEQDLH